MTTSNKLMPSLELIYFYNSGIVQQIDYKIKNKSIINTIYKKVRVFMRGDNDDNSFNVIIETKIDDNKILCSTEFMVKIGMVDNEKEVNITSYIGDNTGKNTDKENVNKLNNLMLDIITTNLDGILYKNGYKRVHV